MAWTTRRASTDVSLADLIEGGILRPPVKLTKRYKDRDFDAELLADGSVRFAGVVYDSCSAAASAATKSVGGRERSNGWRFWLYRDAQGQLVPLDAARQRLLKKRSG
jgi:hypothetical protein